MIATAVAGLTAAITVAIFAEKGAHPTARMARCSMGFLVAIVWIMAIADEVVQVLQVGPFTDILNASVKLPTQTFGFIFGLSDAIIGLTVFAVGNSLADLVANMSVAVSASVLSNKVHTHLMCRCLPQSWASLHALVDLCSTFCWALAYLDCTSSSKHQSHMTCPSLQHSSLVQSDCLPSYLQQ